MTHRFTGREIGIACIVVGSTCVLGAAAIVAALVWGSLPWASAARGIGLPLLLTAGSLFNIAGALLNRPEALKRRRRAWGLCPTCAYDRTGLLPTTICPECGTSPNEHPQPTATIQR